MSWTHHAQKRSPFGEVVLGKKALPNIEDVVEGHFLNVP
eukprot:COSAG01_NODE_29522_length_635_cov_2.531716_1_plen_38_part_01